ncbi:MAG: DUF3685 domain-containing protein [Coleofasciculaceae cyanobacterium]
MSDSNKGRTRVPNLIQILLIDEDPIFRLGLRAALEPFPDLQIFADLDTGTAALETLKNKASREAINLVILELSLGRSPDDQLTGLSLSEQLKKSYPNLPILLLTAQSEPRLLAAVQGYGVEGYCSKGVAIATLVEAIRQLAAGGSYWQTSLTEAVTTEKGLRLSSWRYRLRGSGIEQIERTLAQVTQHLENPNLSDWDWLFWSGRRRELLAARWLVTRLLPVDAVVPNLQSKPLTSPLSEKLPTVRAQPPRQKPRPSAIPSTSALSTLPESSISFDLAVAKLQSSVQNLTEIPLEIDILQFDKRRDLLYIVLQKFEDILAELHFSQVAIEQLPQKRSIILLDLWEVSLTEFFGKYYTLPVGENELEVATVLLGDAFAVQESILEKIPLVVELLSHRLFETALTIDNVAYPAHTPEAMVRSEIILNNLIIQVANAVTQPLLNKFADLETIKQSFYDKCLISSREIARFRNNLSWKYRQMRLISEPIAIFESRYDLLVLNDAGIKKTSIYAPRRQELEQLGGIRLAVTLAYETRDAIAPRLRSGVAWVGSGVVYFLTQVVGRAIGLVIRGVIQGVGSALQDARFGKNSERGK